MRRAFAAWASDHSEGSLLRAWGVWNRFFAFLVDDEVLLRNPMRAVPKPKLPRTAPRSIRHEERGRDPAQDGREPGSEKVSKRWPERDLALVATFCVTGIPLAEAIGLNLDSITGPSYVRPRMRDYGFTITEHDPDRPWIVLASGHRTIKLPVGLDFFTWAHEQWPAPRWSVELDPWQLSPAWPR